MENKRVIQLETGLASEVAGVLNDLVEEIGDFQLVVNYNAVDRLEFRPTDRGTGYRLDHDNPVPHYWVV